MKFRLLAVLLCSVHFLNCEKVISDTVVGLLGIPYAEAPIGEKRFEESSPISFDDSLHYDSWPKRCVGRKLEDGTSEDCLYLSILKHKNAKEKADVLLILTNDDVSEVTLAGYVTKGLSIVVASVRDGVLGSFANGAFGVSDVASAVSFLQTNSVKLSIGKITIWAEGTLAETAASALERIDIARAILINGNAVTRTYAREKYANRATYKMRVESECEIPSHAQSVDCLKSKSIEELLATTEKVTQFFSPFGCPFRAPRPHVPEKNIPTIIGLYKELDGAYPHINDFDVGFEYKTFKKFMAGLIPDSLYKNSPLLRRIAMHQYVHTQGDKKDTYHLYQQMLNMLYDRDYVAPTQRLVHHLQRNKNRVWLMEYGIPNPSRSCIQDGVSRDIAPFCERLLQYFTRFATSGTPTSNSCDPQNPTFPMLGSSKRDYYIVLMANGVPDWLFEFHRPAVELWNNLLPSLDVLELSGRRDAIFPEEQEIDPLLVEDDVQMWHESAPLDDSEISEDRALNDMPHHVEL